MSKVISRIQPSPIPTGQSDLTPASFAVCPELAAVTQSYGAEEQEYYMRELRRLATAADERALAFACDTLIGAVIYHVTFRGRPLEAGDIEHLVEGAIGSLAE
ncbi:hypothetical protein [Sphingopyxis sp.]|uniref:hypothetical protein n=1 Tax=Sphingopyxis sp. TaxID=1908224 RepID=UPI0035B0DA59